MKAAQADPKIYTFILTMRYSGLRISDVAKLRISSLESTNHLVLRTTKSKTPVKVLLPGVVAAALRALKPESRDYFFWNGRSLARSNTDYWRQRRLAPVFKAAEIEHAHPHQFRHSFAVNLLKRGKPAGIVATLLGNTEKVVVQYYSAFVEVRQQGLDDAVIDANDQLLPAAVD